MILDVFFYIFIATAAFSLTAMIYDWVKHRRNLKKFDQFVKDAAIGKKYISYINLDSDDPFKENEQNVYVIIRGIKRNYKGNTWVKVEWSDGNVATMPIEELYYNFYEDESSNCG